jgi:hypothetical protein
MFFRHHGNRRSGYGLIVVGLLFMARRTIVNERLKGV